MGQIYAELELINAWELEAARKNLMDQDDVRRMRITALVDTGSIMLTISEELQEILQFPVVDKRPGDGGCSETLLGAISMEDMDVIIEPRRQLLIPHPDHPDP